MTRRTANKTVTFAQSFRLSEFDEPFPAGRYSIETDEELLDGIFNQRKAAVPRAARVAGVAAAIGRCGP
jgi:hypothetical protein